ncbi:cytochrome P450 4c3 [Phymastichus coffea]|uniref:cytochrome P450 4c3 n=1 Tax=Phymastichus coffea TaxID=108790 RepID=UPI00273BC297|nr:cytochrome P450 4c3 [Phymastichus coffea]
MRKCYDKVASTYPKEYMSVTLTCSVNNFIQWDQGFEKSNILWFGLCILCIGLMLRWWQMKKRYWDYFAQIPGPFALPFIGNLVQLNVDLDELYCLMVGMRLLWGSEEGISKAWLGQKPYVFVSKASTVEPILCSSRLVDKSEDYKFLQPWLGTGLLTSSGAKWHSRRKALTPTFHFNILEDFVQIFAEQTDILVKKISSEVGRASFNIFPYVTLCTLDIICETAMGRRISAQSLSDSNYVRAVYEIGSIVQTRSASLFYQSDFFFRFSSLYRKHKKCIRILHDFSKKVIAERKKEILDDANEINGNKGSNYSLLVKKKRLAFLDLLIKASENGYALTDNDIREEVDTFMFEGHDTTSSAICWTIYLLGCHPEVQKKVVDELDLIFSQGYNERQPTLQDLKSMKYLEKCIKEALRLYPSVPLLGRNMTEDLKLGNYIVPKGTTVLMVLPVLHRDPEVFENPEKFDPDRFSSKNCIKRSPYAYIPFSAGTRNCIGQKFALLEEKCIISGILRKFVIEAAERREDIRISAELIIRAKNGLHIKIKSRSTKHSTL